MRLLPMAKRFLASVLADGEQLFEFKLKLCTRTATIDDNATLTNLSRAYHHYK